MLKTGNWFKYLCKTFPHLSEAKLKEGVFAGPDIRKLTFDEDFFLLLKLRDLDTLQTCCYQLPGKQQGP
jgi:hypothetical protein